MYLELSLPADKNGGLNKIVGTKKRTIPLGQVRN
jgi:hypothetical protein